MQGYFRFPTINKSNLVFVCEDDLWIVDINKPTARRLTANFGNISSPVISEDGKTIAYIGQEDGNTEIFTMSINGGQSQRITFEGGQIANISAWNKNTIYYSSSLDSPFGRTFDLRSVSILGGESSALNYGMIKDISFNGNNIVLGKNTADLARWKRYKGGTAGKLLINKSGSNQEFNYLINLDGNISSPMYISDRIYFTSDHDGIGNIYSCLKSGKGLKKHTNHNEYYVRNATTDKHSIVYQSGADIYIYNIKKNKSNLIKINYNSPKIHISRKFVNCSSYLERFSFNESFSHINVIARGKAFTMGNWNGPVFQHGNLNGVRYNHPTTTKGNKNILLTSDLKGKDNIEIHSIEKHKMIKRLKSSCGRILSIKRSPTDDLFAIINYKHELILLNLKKDLLTIIDRSKKTPLSCNWSPCGKFIAYSCSNKVKCRVIKIYDLKNKKSHTITEGISSDSSPVFDPNGKFLAFLSNRTFNPVYDSIQFDLGFPVSDKPYIVVLSKITPSPFLKDPNDLAEVAKKSDKKKKPEKIKTVIDFKNIQDRIIGIPIKESSLDTSIGFNNNKIFYLSWPLISDNNSDSNIKGTLKYYDLNLLEEKNYVSGVVDFNVIKNNMVIYNGNDIRLLLSDSPPTKEALINPKFNKPSGLIDLNRIKIEINLIQEWKQMYSEAWRLQRDHFWVPNMSNINWKKVHDRYYSLIDRLGTRSEFSDLVWEMQGELGTSHCYEMGGDYTPTRKYYDGILGAKLKYNNSVKGYQITEIFKGDLWINPQSPLMLPGINVNVNDCIKRINGVNLTKKITPGEILVNLCNKEVELSICTKNGKGIRNVIVKTLSNDKHLKYRDWVEKNRKYVHSKSKGKIGYLHIPDMGVHGYAEFHRYFLTEISYDGLIVDVRYNGGGHISQLLLSKLARKRIGYDITRWMGKDPYPAESPAGPMVGITNEFAGSDGDIFSHSWKLLNLGKLIGKRTWGGVIGIWPRNALVDGTMTSQPEFSFWFKDVGWEVENYGTDVDVEVDNMPQDNLKKVDNQLDKGIEIVLKDLSKKGSLLKADFRNKPDLKLP